MRLPSLDFAAGSAGILGYSTLYGVIGEATSATTGSTGVWGVTFFPNTFGVLGQIGGQPSVPGTQQTFVITAQGLLTILLLPPLPLCVKTDRR
jgi:hypothetical protein